jgi:serine phosphatase RsbU (regulator of sigma subunit)
VGGDFYDAFEIGGGVWIVTIGDVCGKGAEAAAVTGLARHTIRAAALREPRPSAVLQALNTAVLRELSDDRFLTVCGVRLRRAGQSVRLTICSAGHPLPLVLQADGGVTQAGMPNTLLGVLPEVHLRDQVLDLGPGDALVLYTDGVTEAAAPSGRGGPEALVEALVGAAGLDAERIAAHVERTLIDPGTQLRDDFAIVVLRVDPGTPLRDAAGTP